MKRIIVLTALTIILSACTRQLGRLDDFQLSDKEAVYDLEIEAYLQNLNDLENEIISLKKR